MKKPVHSFDFPEGKGKCVNCGLECRTTKIAGLPVRQYKKGKSWIGSAPPCFINDKLKKKLLKRVKVREQK